MQQLGKSNRGWTRHQDHAPAGQPSAEVPAPPAKRPRKPFAWRLVRLSFLTALLAVLGWWLVIPLIFPVTSRAVVNARVVQVRSPIDGVNAALNGEVGDEVPAGHPLAHVANGRVDTSHLDELQARLAGLEAQRERLVRDLKEARAEVPAARERVNRYEKTVTEGLESAILVARTREEAATLDLDGQQKRLARLSRLTSNSTATKAELEEMQTAASRSKKDLEKEQATLSRLRAELAAAKQGVFLQNEAAYSKKRADDLEQNVASLQSGLKENAARICSADAHLLAERKRTDAMKEVVLASPVAGVVWKRTSNPGQAVKQHELIYEVADPGTIFVEAVLHQRCLGCVAVGAEATVNLTGGGRLRGTVRAVRTLGEGEAEASFALRLAAADVKQVLVIIALDREAQDPALIGRHARVLITSPEPTSLEQCVAWLYRRVGG